MAAKEKVAKNHQRQTIRQKQHNLLTINNIHKWSQLFTPKIGKKLASIVVIFS